MGGISTSADGRMRLIYPENITAVFIVNIRRERERCGVELS